MRERITIKCPSCGAQFQVGRDAIGKQASCGRCRRTFFVREDPPDRILEDDILDWIGDPIDELYDHYPPKKYFEALERLGFPDQIATETDMVSHISRIMGVMAGNELPRATESEMSALIVRCASYGYKALSSGPRDAVADALGRAIWKTGARRLNTPPFGPHGTESIQIAKSCAMELKCQFITADNPGNSTIYSHVVAQKDRKMWWFAGSLIAIQTTLGSIGDRRHAILPIEQAHTAKPPQPAGSALASSTAPPSKKELFRDCKYFRQLRSSEIGSHYECELKKLHAFVDDWAGGNYGMNCSMCLGCTDYVLET